MMRFIIFMLLTLNSAYALEAVVTVLEAPMFRHKSYEAPVVQYLRRGDIIKVHPSLANDPKMNQFAPSREKYLKLKKKMQETPEWKQDPLFRGVEENTFYVEDEFIPTLDRQGNTVYVLSEHIFVYFNDTRELTQSIAKKDPTDYRLEEPLPRNYPLNSPTGYRGQFILGITQPYFESYPYKDNVRTKGYMSPIDANVTLMKSVKGNYHERMFFGGTFSVRAFKNSYTFADKRLSEETGLRLGIGPTISYDAFKGEKNRVNLSGSVIVNFFNQLNISQSLGSLQDDRTYRGLSLGPRFHLQYHRKQILEDIDFVLGTSMEMESATSFQAKNGGSQASWWRALGSDKFMTRTTFTLGGYVGIQSAY